MRLIVLTAVLATSLMVGHLVGVAPEAGKPARIGWLTSSVVHTRNVEAFRDGMRALGHQLVVNLKAAKQLGVTIPQTILLQADRVFQ
jgi:hypothetical protein